MSHISDFDWAKWLGPRVSEKAEAVLDRVLAEPVRSILSRPSKKIRSRLVNLGYELARANTPGSQDLAPNTLAQVTEVLATVMEEVHAGSLVIDDIQDGSLERRGAPTVHRLFGLPLALNAGNFLYFRPLERIRALGDVLPADVVLGMSQEYDRALLRAHCGQAVDLGVSMLETVQGDCKELALASLELKTGALMGLALSLGAWIARPSPEVLASVRDYGERFGVSLQMFDDAGNLSSSFNIRKKQEDLLLGRPSWVWATAAEVLSAADFEKFRTLVRNLKAGDTAAADALNGFMGSVSLLVVCEEKAKLFLSESFEILNSRLTVPASVFQGLSSIGEQLTHAYK